MTIPVVPRATYLQCAFKFGFHAGDVPPTSFYDPVDFTKVEITNPVQEADVLTSNMEGSIGEALASVNKPSESAKIALEADYMPPALLALLMGADLSELAQSTAPVVDEAVTPVLGLWVPLAHRYLETSGISAKTAAEAAVTSDHYAVDTVNGLFKALDATGATVAKLSYTKSDRTGEIYKGGKVKSAYLMLVGTGTEKVSQKRCRIVIFKASLAASSTFDPVAGGYLKGSLAGNLLTPSTETSPYQYEYLDLASTL
ncbi:MAG: hypothetical protein H6974_09395 [Gammaproteobacteria bacterium]|nr:hypothetical protein [Gammaproteobacteria bacterium]